MPALSIWSIRAALLYFALGITIGSLILINKSAHVLPAVWSLLHVHIECVWMGFVVQLTLGVAHWIFPRLTTLIDRGRIGFAVAAIVLLNAGILLVCAGPFIDPMVSAIGRASELAAAVSFVIHLWPRIYPFGKY
jgi:hypothetical protein